MTLKEEYANEISYLAGPIVSNAKMPWYDKMLKHLGELEDETSEVRKNEVYLQCIVKLLK